MGWGKKLIAGALVYGAAKRLVREAKKTDEERYRESGVGGKFIKTKVIDFPFAKVRRLYSFLEEYNIEHDWALSEGNNKDHLLFKKKRDIGRRLTVSLSAVGKKTKITVAQKIILGQFSGKEKMDYDEYINDLFESLDQFSLEELQGSNDYDVEDNVSQTKKSFCSTCGSKMGKIDKFCSGCGKKQ